MIRSLVALLLLAAPALAQTAVQVQIPTGAGTGAGLWVPVGPNNPLPVTGAASGPLFVKPSPLTLVPLDVAAVTTGGTAVTALTAGHRTAGGWLQNPPTASINLCINEIGTATGTTSAGSTTCVVPGQTYVLAPAAGAVSVVSSDSSHAFSGEGFQ